MTRRIGGTEFGSGTIKETWNPVIDPEICALQPIFVRLLFFYFSALAQSLFMAFIRMQKMPKSTLPESTKRSIPLYIR